MAREESLFADLPTRIAPYQNVDFEDEATFVYEVDRKSLVVRAVRPRAGSAASAEPDAPRREQATWPDLEEEVTLDDGEQQTVRELMSTASVPPPPLSFAKRSCSLAGPLAADVAEEGSDALTRRQGRPRRVPPPPATKTTPTHVGGTRPPPSDFGPVHVAATVFAAVAVGASAGIALFHSLAPAAAVRALAEVLFL